MAAISKHTYEYLDDKCLILANEEWVRLLPFSNDWCKIRIGLLVAIPFGATVQDGILAFGVCSGNTAPFSALWTQNSLGLVVGNLAGSGATRNWTFNAGSGNPYFTCPQYPYAMRRYGQTLATSQAGQFYVAQANVGTQKRRSPIIMDITRTGGGAGLATISCWAPSTTTVLVDYHPEHLLDGVDQFGLPTVNGQALTVSANALTVAQSDTFGPLDSIFVYWSKQFPPIEVYAIAVSVVGDGYWPSGVGGAYDSLGTYPTFSYYNTGSIANGGTLNGGAGWAGPYVVVGTGYPGNPSPVVGFSGTSLGPYDSFEQYGTGTVLSGSTLTAGTGFTGPGMIYGQGIVAPRFGFFAGTSTGDYDSFESYAIGTVTSGVTVNAGSNWGGPAYIY